MHQLLFKVIIQEKKILEYVQLNLATNIDGFPASTIIIGSALSTIYLRGNLIYDNADMSVTNLPDFIKQVTRNRI